MIANSFSWLELMRFSAKVIALRKARGLTRQGLADLTDSHIPQIKRYEAGTAERSAEVAKGKKRTSTQRPARATAQR